MSTFENNNLNLNIESFRRASDEEKAQVVMPRPIVGYWQDVYSRLKRNKTAYASLIIILFLVVVAIVIPILSPYGYEQIIRDEVQQGPSFEHPFGTDNLGRDMLVRCAVGLRISLIIGLISAIIVVFIGVTYGAISGFYGGKVDTVMMRIVDIIYSVPSLLLAILLQVVLKDPLTALIENHPNLEFLDRFGAGLISIIIVLSLLFWVDMARIVRGQILSLRQQEFVLAAKTLGTGNRTIIFKHLIPNCMGVIVVTTCMNIPQAIFYEAFLSFIGLGVSVPMASLGSLVNSGIQVIYTYPYVLIEPALLISLLILAFNLFGDGLNDALDPRLKK